eukprot:GHRR01017947.1.p1 GENE.GHRR01017947.1~~GHRR01017947.1.p1  ORF type:complete len:131 (-),score=34.28 GHRR01017947.1:199-591(-)
MASIHCNQPALSALCCHQVGAQTETELKEKKLRVEDAPLKLIAENAGTNGSVVMQRVIDSADPDYGYNAATGQFEDLMQSGIIDPTKVIRCALENACSVAKTFLLADVVVTEIPEKTPAAAGAGVGDYDY